MLKSDDYQAARVRDSLRSRLFGIAPRGIEFGRFTVREYLGGGSTGHTYVVRDPELECMVALKLAHSQAGRRPTLVLPQLRSIGTLCHPHVVDVHEAGVVNAQSYVVMDYMRGGTLQDWLELGGRSWCQIVHKFVDAGRGLVAAHGVGVAHPSFQTHNVLLDEHERCQVSDFGVAWPGRDAKSAIDDQFSLCAALSRALYGIPPRQHRGVPRRLARALRRGLHSEPDRRFASMEALVLELVAATPRPDPGAA